MDEISTDGLTYSTIGAARPDAAPVPGLRARTQRIRVGEGDVLWERAVAVVSGWAIKTAIGFTVEPDDAQVVLGRDYDTTYHRGFIHQFEPVRVVWIAEEPDCRGFGYGTRVGHPITGEECFLVERDPDGTVWLVVRTVSRVSGGRWRWLWPGIRIAQPYFQRAYARSAMRLIVETDEPLPGLRGMRRGLVSDGPSGVEGISRLGYGLGGPEKTPFDDPPQEPVELDPAELPWELRGDEREEASGE
ncbi:DUF1990 family protein [Protaetiibacter mangrovi]|uniref:DUF1990 domain-containing protein n=1 Tax=Protaetiibacter mangrovi TaxID=2970926 RepID=A0ABT1ZEW9_9MICO|nr:DUF1990 domain-containing protein [Protaetiibacter mangrovi]MCS0499242.1 DUF1990 domain-containing protein [Protaetiibacter mangrovi]TPX04780.1 DUF1990 domain-containing protein [Schumannella luteola]